MEKDAKMQIPLFRLSICNVKQEELNYALKSSLFFFASQHFCGKIGYKIDIFAFPCAQNFKQRMAERYTDQQGRKAVHFATPGIQAQQGKQQSGPSSKQLFERQSPTRYGVAVDKVVDGTIITSETMTPQITGISKSK